MDEFYDIEELDAIIQQDDIQEAIDHDKFEQDSPPPIENIEDERRSVSAERDEGGADFKENQQRSGKRDDLANAVLNLYNGGITDQKTEEIIQFINSIKYPHERLNAELVKRYIDLDRNLPEPIRNKKKELVEGVPPDLVRYHRLFTKN